MRTQDRYIKEHCSMMGDMTNLAGNMRAEAWRQILENSQITDLHTLVQMISDELPTHPEVKRHECSPEMKRVLDGLLETGINGLSEEEVELLAQFQRILRSPLAFDIDEGREVVFPPQQGHQTIDLEGDHMRVDKDGTLTLSRKCGDLLIDCGRDEQGWSFGGSFWVDRAKEDVDLEGAIAAVKQFESDVRQATVTRGISDLELALFELRIALFSSAESDAGEATN